MFVTAEFTNWLFGIIIFELSGVVKTLYKIWTQSTVPSLKDVFMYSPLRKGLKKRINTH